MVLKGFELYLSKCAQYNSIKNLQSCMLSITHSVPQGSIVNPLFFLLFINNFLTQSSFFKFNLFDDDRTLSCCFDKLDEKYIMDKGNLELLKVIQWLNGNKLKVNHS